MTPSTDSLDVQKETDSFLWSAGHHAKLPTRDQGLDSREAVILQSKDLPSSDIIMLESDNESHDERHGPSNTYLRYQQEDHGSGAAVDFRRIRLNSARPAVCDLTDAAERSYQQTSMTKKKLFSSSGAAERMSRSSGLLSPPVSSGNSPKSSFRNMQSGGGVSLIHPAIVGEVAELHGKDSVNDEDFSIQYARSLALFDTHANNIEGQRVDRVATIDVSQTARTFSEAQGILTSQQLRAQRKAKFNLRRRSSADGGPRYTTITPRHDSPHVDEIWHARDDALGIPRSADLLNNSENSFSRHAANSFRTQSRHLQRDDNNIESQVELDERAKNRLARITANAVGPRSDSKRKRTSGAISSCSTRPEKRVKFYAPELDSSSRSGNSPSRTRIRNGLTTISELMSIRSSNVRPSKASDVTGISNTGELYPEQGADWKAPPNFNNWPADRQECVKRRHILTERERDLNLILDLFQLFAQLYATPISRDGYESKLGEFEVFTEAVLVQNRSGHRARPRFSNVKSKIKERMNGLGMELDSAKIDEKLSDIMQQSFLEKLRDEMPRVQSELEEVRVRCSEYNSYKRIRERGTRASEITKSKSKATRSQASCEAFKRSRRRQIDGLQSQLARFSSNNESLPAMDEDSELKAIDLNSTASDDESTVSEENDGCDFMAPVVFETPTQPNDSVLPASTGDIDASRKEQNAQTQVSTKMRPIQAPNQSLFEQMAARAQQRDQLNKQGTQKPHARISKIIEQCEAIQTPTPATLNNISKDSEGRIEVSNSDVEEGTNQLEAYSEKEFDDSDLDEESEGELEEFQNSEGNPTCRRYAVKMLSVGLGPDYDGDEHLVGRYLSREQAVKSVLSVAPWFKDEYARLHPYTTPEIERYALTDSNKEYEQRISLEEDDQVACRTWIVEELYNPSEEAYQNAKVKRACKSPRVWFVDWKKTIASIENIPEDGNENDSDNKSNDKSSDDGIDNDDQELLEPQSTNEETTSNTNVNTKSPIPPIIEDYTDSDFAELFESNTPEPVTASFSKAEIRQVDKVTVTSATPASIPVIERPTFDALRLFTSPADANRHAKEVFMQWFISHLHGPGNYDYIKLEDETIEAQLKRIGDRDLWERQEEFEVDREEGKMIETLKVWVRKAQSSGCSN